MANETMTQEEYLKHSGTHCPYCHGDKVTAGTLQADGATAVSEVTCEGCGQVWQEIWTLKAWEAVGDGGAVQ